MPLLNSKWNEELAAIIRAYGVRFAELGVAFASRQKGVKAIDDEFLSIISDYSLKLSLQINGESEAELQSIVQQGMDDGLSTDELTSKIKDALQYNADVRSEVIARTESTRFEMRGRIYEWAKSGIVETKVWVASEDACPYCLALNGKVVTLDENFLNLGDSVDAGDRVFNANFEDVIAPPLHPNCRCALVAGISEDEESDD